MSPRAAAQQHLYIDSVYQRYGERLVLDNVDLSVSEGEFCTVVGPSGCGKSTLLRLILGQEQPVAGNIEFMGAPLGACDMRRGIVYQKYSLFPNLTVLENVQLGLSLKVGVLSSPRKKRAAREEAMLFLSEVRLAEHAHKYPFELSGGMQQRVAIAQAAIMRPRILMMDEPFGALDPGTREHMQVFILDLWEKAGMTVFFVTHDLEEAVFLGTRLVVLSQYYTDGRGPDVQRGSRIVADYKLSDLALPTHAKSRTDFRDLVEKIRHESFDPEHRQNVKDFNLSHPDSFQTLTDEEKR